MQLCSFGFYLDPVEFLSNLFRGFLFVVLLLVIVFVVGLNKKYQSCSDSKNVYIRCWALFMRGTFYDGKIDLSKLSCPISLFIY